MNHHNSLPIPDDVPDPVDHPDAYYDFSLDSAPGLSQDEISEESVIHHEDPLVDIDKELVAAGHLDVSGTSVDDEEEPVEGIDFELSNQSLEQFATDLRSTWHSLGVRGYRQVTKERLRDLDPETVLQLDRYTAELIYFDTSKKVWGSLGSEPVYAELLLRQLQPPADPAHPARGIDLVKLRSKAREEADNYLKELKVDEGQLRTMGLGGPKQQHDVVRLAYVLAEEPALGKLRQRFIQEASSRVEALDLVVLAKTVRNELKNCIFKCKRDLREETSAKNGPKLEYINHLQYDRVMRSAESSLYLVEQVLAGWGIGRAKPGREAK